MRKIIYTSRATCEFTTPDLIDLLAIARRRNHELAISGMLLYANGSFMQAIEGHPDVVDDLYEHICADIRHADICRLCDREIDTRQFADWSMGFAHPDRAWLQDHIEGYAPSQGIPFTFEDLVEHESEADALLTLTAQRLRRRDTGLRSF